MPGFEWMRAPAHGGRIAFRANDPEALVGAATAGLGLCAVPCLLGDPERTLARVPSLGFSRCDLFLVTHTETGKTPRVRAVTDFLGRVLSESRAAIEG
jgi:DNA-binding transcriptional LysR family regulator